jgi:hypothetical protein
MKRDQLEKPITYEEGNNVISHHFCTVLEMKEL